VRSLVSALGSHPGGLLRWIPVTLPYAHIPWVGVALPSLDAVLGRRWIWDVTVPDLDDAGDTLTLRVVQDVCVVTLAEVVAPNRRIHMTVPVHRPPEEIAIPAERLCPSPWTVGLEVGWSAGRIATAVSDWISLSVGRSDVRVQDPELPDVDGPTSSAPGERDRFEAAPGLAMDSAAFDTLLTIDPAVASELMLCLQAIHESLGPWRADLGS
jgi:hypothetical protein